MSGDIELHPTKALNPFLTYCCRCKGEAPEIVLVGGNDGIYECSAGASVGGPHKMIGRPKPSMRDGLCEECGFNTSWTRVGTLEDGQRIQSRQPCDPCLKEIEEHKKIVDAGGVYFQCDDCKAKGVIRGTAPLSMMVREQHQEDEEKRYKAQGTTLVDGWFTKPIHNKGNDLVYLPCGIRFKKEQCPACGPNKVEPESTKPT